MKEHLFHLLYLLILFKVISLCFCGLNCTKTVKITGSIEFGAPEKSKASGSSIRDSSSIVKKSVKEESKADGPIRRPRDKVGEVHPEAGILPAPCYLDKGLGSSDAEGRGEGRVYPEERDRSGHESGLPDHSQGEEGKKERAPPTGVLTKRDRPTLVRFSSSECFDPDTPDIISTETSGPVEEKAEATKTVAKEKPKTDRTPRARVKVSSESKGVVTSGKPPVRGAAGRRPVRAKVKKS